MRACILPGVLAIALLVAGTSPAHAVAPAVVINEIHYHPANDDDRLQFIELHNPGDIDIDLSGWKLRGAKFEFPPNTKIRAGAFLVVARDLRALQSVHGPGFSGIGNLGGRLKRGGEKLELIDSAGTVIDSLTYSDDAPWPLAPDGYASTLERISPAAPAGDPHNWAPSRRATRKGREGTPGRANDNASPHPLPIVEDVKWDQLPAPNKPISVVATIRADNDLRQALLNYYTFQGGRFGPTNELQMERLSGDSGKGLYQAVIPAQSGGTLVRFTITASNAAEAIRIFPSENEPRPALSAYVATSPSLARIPGATIINTARTRGGGHKFEPARDDIPEVGSSAFVYSLPDGQSQLFDFVQVRNRSGGWKVHFLKDQLLEGMGGINLISEGPPRWMLAEHLSYELYRRAGMNIQKSGHYRLQVDGRDLGYMLFVEQPNKTFLARSGRNNDGNLYKIQWFHQDMVRAHEKKTNKSDGHDDIVSLLQNLNRLKGEAQWKFIQQHFDLTNVISYFAVNMCIQNWDGFFNNHYAYHDLRPGGKWEVIPWDEDKTWGEYDGASGNYDWYEMPLTMGMTGDRPPRQMFGGGPFGGANWWRPAGWFSGPLLSNPQFRRQFMERLRELCHTQFTPERFGPVIQGLSVRLRPEVEEQARSRKLDPQSALRQFDRDIESFHRQLENRRKFILKELK